MPSFDVRQLLARHVSTFPKSVYGNWTVIKSTKVDKRKGKVQARQKPTRQVGQSSKRYSLAGSPQRDF